ncbi:hypothetical protein BDV96DRAFT_53836 [Lophiotrema nucula]|uniref:Ribonuclease H1 N-terminal domain-containing protein n=1 Tax=Lophiotrema nucula TaxID=690887 RepID=A0A6A5Z7Y6_9PLEO|nr:hypothetical protein BDV96DRAFT_53836 [Lophiotrema nucula]
MVRKRALSVIIDSGDEGGSSPKRLSQPDSEDESKTRSSASTLQSDHEDESQIRPSLKGSEPDREHGHRARSSRDSGQPDYDWDWRVRRARDNGQLDHEDRMIRHSRANSQSDHEDGSRLRRFRNDSQSSRRDRSSPSRSSNTSRGSTLETRVATIDRLNYIFSRLDNDSLIFLYELARYGSSRNGRMAEQILRDGLITAANAHMSGTTSGPQQPPSPYDQPGPSNAYMPGPSAPQPSPYSFGQPGPSNAYTGQPYHQQMHHPQPAQGSGSRKRGQKWYAVRRGYRTGLFPDWDLAEAAVTGYPGARYKGFSSWEEANQWFNNAPRFQGVPGIQPRQSTLQFPRVLRGKGKGKERARDDDNDDFRD